MLAEQWTTAKGWRLLQGSLEPFFVYFQPFPELQGVERATSEM